MCVFNYLHIYLFAYQKLTLEGYTKILIPLAAYEGGNCMAGAQGWEGDFLTTSLLYFLNF